jgi:pantoate--beta-alanine ligase
MKLFQAVFATTGGGTAVFGQKDYQQLMVIRRMVQQFALPIEIIGCATRADSGLALSSRNGYLSDEQRVQAMALSQALKALADAARQGGNLADLEAQAMAALRAKGWEPDYLSVRQRSDLQTPADARSGDLVALGAARLGSTRLIDNLEF